MKKLLIAFGVLVTVAALAGAVAYVLRDRRISSFAETPFGSADIKEVTIPSGSSPKTVAALLVKAHIVSDEGLCYAYLRREKLGPRLKAGEYEFTGPVRPADAIAKLIRGEVKLYRFTIPEGLRVEEILSLLSASELALSKEKLDTLVRDAAFARKLGIPADSFEGFLAPDTYAFTRAATEEAVLRKMVERTFEVLRAAPRKAGLTLNELEAITLASIVEKETGAAEERPRIACVFHNRLRLGMKLQTDPTVLYAKLLRTGSFTKNITKADLLEPHPYNTYTVKGLPPGPIASPGAAAIAATLDPPSCDDLFFVSRNDGTSVFCPDLECHNAAVKTWQVDYFKTKRPGTKAPRSRR